MSQLNEFYFNLLKKSYSPKLDLYFLKLNEEIRSKSTLKVTPEFTDKYLANFLKEKLIFI